MDLIQVSEFDPLESVVDFKEFMNKPYIGSPALSAHVIFSINFTLSRINPGCNK